MEWGLKDKPPTVLLLAFADSSIALELFVWTDRPFERPVLKSEVLWEIWRQFEAENIEISFPQMDVHIKEIPSKSAVLDG